MIDLSELVTEPELGAIEFTYHAVREYVNDKGRSVVEFERKKGIGLIQPAGDERELLEEGDREKSAITVYTQAPLVAGDKIIFNRNCYVVALVEVWVTGGYTRAVAVLKDKIS